MKHSRYVYRFVLDLIQFQIIPYGGLNCQYNGSLIEMFGKRVNDGNCNVLRFSY